MLIEIFTDSRSLSLGFAFSNDMALFKRTLPEMKFFERFANFLDIDQFYFKARNKDITTIGLKTVVLNILGAPLCKGE